MSETRKAIETLESGWVADKLYLTVFPNDESGRPVINLAGRDGRELIPADIDEIRTTIAEAGYRTVDEWYAWSNVSWLSDGVPAGVSFRLEKMG